MSLPAVSSTSFSAVLEAPTAIVDFWAEWCSPCRALKPIITQLATELYEKVLIVGVNVDEESELTTSFNIMSIPTLIFFKNGKEVHRTSGGFSRIELIAEIQTHFGF
jgi:thioredoxin